MFGFFNIINTLLKRPGTVARLRLDHQDRFVVESGLLRSLRKLEVKSQGRAGNARLPVTRPAEQHFGRRDRVQHSIGRS